MSKLRRYCWLVVMLAGCSSGQTDFVPVTGRVLYRGQPLAGGTVVFSPDPTRGNRGEVSWAILDADGHFRLQGEQHAGVRVGWYRISIAGPAELPLPSHYLDPEVSGQFVEIQAGRNNHCELQLD